MVHMQLCWFHSSSLCLLIVTLRKDQQLLHILQCLLLVAATLLFLRFLVIVMVSDPARSSGLDLTHVDM